MRYFIVFLMLLQGYVFASPNIKPASAEKKPHLILHFDMNKTLIATDKAGKKSSHDIVTASIADRIFDTWDSSIKKPISYFKYVKYHLLPNPESSRKIKLEQNRKIASCLDDLNKQNHPEYPRLQKEYDYAMSILKNQKTQVFTSFYNLISYLDKEKIPYTLVIRTFGSEASEIVEELNENIKADFINKFYSLKKGHIKDLKTDLYSLISKEGNHLAIRDDYKWWFNNLENWKYGKPFPVDLNNNQTISLFFDDNAGHDINIPDRNIVFPYNIKDNSPIHPKLLIEKNRLFPVDMLEALCDSDYYIKAVKKALDNC